MNRPLYLDFNATTPLAPEALQAMRPWLEDGQGNPSSNHFAGLPARDAIETARCQTAALLQCDATELVFTSGGSEANNHAIKGVAQARRKSIARPHIITTQIEHPSVLEPCAFLERQGARVTRLRVDRFGMVDPDDVEQAIGADTILVSVMHANNEVGSIQPIAEIARIAHEHGVPFHTDAAQTVGKVPVDVESLDVDLLTVAGHKLYGPKGVGALFIREGWELEPLVHGAGHEAGRRAGTENTPGIVGLGAACQAARECIGCESIRQRRDYLWQRLQDEFGEQVALNGHPEERLPNTLNVSFIGCIGSDLLARLPMLAASTGSACHAGSAQVSPVLQAMGVPMETALGAVRFSLGRTTTVAELDGLLEQLRRVAGAEWRPVTQR